MSIGSNARQLAAANKQIDAAQAYVRAYNDWKWYNDSSLLFTAEERNAWYVLLQAEKQLKKHAKNRTSEKLI